MKTHFITFLLLVGMSLGISSRLHAQSSYQPGEENLKAREEFQDNKFGIFSGQVTFEYLNVFTGERSLMMVISYQAARL